MFDRNFRLNLSGLLMAAVLIAGCSGGAGSNQSNQSGRSGASSQPAAAAPAVSPTAATGPSPTPLPTVKPALGRQAPVPDLLKRAMTPEEMRKAMQALPPKVRERIMGLGLRKVPQPSPQPAKK